MSDLIFARLQMAMSLGFHIVFAAIGIAMPLLMAISEYLYLRTNSPVALELTKRWSKGVAIFFAVGAVSGTVLSFELGLLWPEFMAKTGGIIGLPFALEGFAFFAEAIFLGIFLYGWQRIHKWVHFLSGVLVACAGALSGAFVMMANAWMNAPVGFLFDAETKTFLATDPFAVMKSPAWAAQTVHMLVAAYMATGLAVAAVHAYGLIKERRNEFHRLALKIAMAVAIPATLLQPLIGDWAAKTVAHTQPVKLAAMEGQFETQSGAPLRIGGIPDVDAEVTRYAIEIPKLLSFIAYGNWDAKVVGLKEVPKENWPPAAIVHLSFQAMVAIGFFLCAICAWFIILLVRRKKMPDNVLLLWLLTCCAPLGFIAIELGWMVTEIGRQPWIVNGVMRVSEAVTPMPGIIVPFITFTLIYLLLTFVLLVVMRHQIGKSPLMLKEEKS